MFQISITPTRKTASALTVLAAMGASGMVAQVAEAAAVEMEPTQAARGTNASYLGPAFATNWKNWLAETGNTGIGPNQRGYATWAVDFGLGAISSAAVRIEPINHNATYGVPVGATIDFALLTEPWTSSTPDASNTGPSVGTAPGTEFIQRTAPVDIPFNADVTSLLQHWQSNPTAYYGIRMYFSETSGAQAGVYAPNAPPPDSVGVTANLVLDQAIPEPTTLSLLGLAGVLGLRRRRKT